jgi:phosphohistidine phosphatase
MKNLILVRHAKSSWEVPVQDKDRINMQWNERCPFVAGHVKSLPKTFTIWCSSAKELNTALIFCTKFCFRLTVSFTKTTFIPLIENSFKSG